MQTILYLAAMYKRINPAITALLNQSKQLIYDFQGQQVVYHPLKPKDTKYEELTELIAKYPKVLMVQPKYNGMRLILHEVKLDERVHDFGSCLMQHIELPWFVEGELVDPGDTFSMGTASTNKYATKNKTIYFFDLIQPAKPMSYHLRYNNLKAVMSLCPFPHIHIAPVIELCETMLSDVMADVDHKHLIEGIVIRHAVVNLPQIKERLIMKRYAKPAIGAMCSKIALRGVCLTTVQGILAHNIVKEREISDKTSQYSALMGEHKLCGIHSFGLHQS